MTKFQAILILADGDTWMTIDGASIAFITENDLERLCEGDIDCEDLEPAYEIGLRGFPQVG